MSNERLENETKNYNELLKIQAGRSPTEETIVMVKRKRQPPEPPLTEEQKKHIALLQSAYEEIKRQHPEKYYKGFEFFSSEASLLLENEDDERIIEMYKNRLND